MLRSNLIGTLRAAERGGLLSTDVDDYIGGAPLRAKNDGPTVRVKRSSVVPLAASAAPVERAQKASRPSPTTIPLNKTKQRMNGDLNSNILIQKQFISEKPFDVRISAESSQLRKRSSERFLHAQDHHDITAVDIQRSLSKAAAILPDELLLKHHMHDIVKQRAVVRLFKALDRVRFRVLQVHFHRWRAKTSHLTYTYASRIQRFFQYAHQVSRARRHLLEINDKTSNELSVRRAIDYIRWTAAVTLQRRTRGIIARAGYFNLRRQLQAKRQFERFAVAVVIAIRCLKACKMSRMRRQQVVRSVCLVQKLGRGFLARKLYKELTAKRKRRWREVYGGENEGTKKFFARHGAALLIQRMYRAYIRRIRGNSRNSGGSGSVTRIPKVDILRLILLIQSTMRRYIAIKRVNEIRRANMLPAIMKIQHFWRRTIARMHLHSLIHKKLKFVRLKKRAITILGAWVRSALADRIRRESMRLFRIKNERSEVLFRVING